MEHIYQDIEGWFDFHELYAEQVKNAKDGHHFVEIGAWKGRSASFMAVEIVNSEKNIIFDVVDTWEGSDELQDDPHLIKNGTIIDVYLKNIEPVKHVINSIVSNSVNAAKRYHDKSLDFVFIDGSHDYVSVKNDLHAWYPKVKDGGTIAGHDYGWPWYPEATWPLGKYGSLNDNVAKAVDEFFDVVLKIDIHKQFEPAQLWKCVKPNTI
jgi:hypothetical protein